MIVVDIYAAGKVGSPARLLASAEFLACPRIGERVAVENGETAISGVVKDIAHIAAFRGLPASVMVFIQLDDE